MSPLTTEEWSRRISEAAKLREARKRAGLPPLKETKERKRCACGCGELVARPGSRYLPGHHFKAARRYASGKTIDPEGEWLALPVLLRCAKCGWTKAEVPGNLAASTYRTHSCTAQSGSDTDPASA